MALDMHMLVYYNARLTLILQLQNGQIPHFTVFGSTSRPRERLLAELFSCLVYTGSTSSLAGLESVV